MKVYRSKLMIDCYTICYTANGPDPPQIFTLVKVSDNKIAIKSGFGRYVSCGTTGELVGRAEAIGPRELWETVFENVCKHVNEYIKMHLFLLYVLLSQ